MYHAKHLYDSLVGGFVDKSRKSSLARKQESFSTAFRDFKRKGCEMSVKVSIIIPVYNTEKYLRKCLDSVCNQTLQDIEIICVNDCSTDDSLEILKEYASNDNRIKIINFTENKGVAVARNTAIEQAKGEYIGFVDSDDYVDLDFYEKLYNTAKSENAELVVGKTQMENENGVKQKDPIFDNFFSQVRKNKLHFTQFFGGGGYKKELLDKHSIRFTDGLVYGEDRLLPLQASYYSNKLSLVDDTIYHYVRNDDSITINKKNERIMCSFIAYNQMVFEFINSVGLSIDDYSVVAIIYLDECIFFTLALDGLLQNRYYTSFKNDIFPLIMFDRLNDTSLYKQIQKILLADDFNAYVNFIKKCRAKRMLELVRQQYISQRSVNA